MELVGTGIDIVELKRVSAARYLLRVAEFFLTPRELEGMRQSRNAVQYVASRLAAKEAVIKACPERLYYHDFSIEQDGEKLAVVMHKKLAQPYKIFVSIAHEFSYAVSSAIITV